MKELSRIKKQKRDYKIKIDEIITRKRELENQLQDLENIEKELKKLKE